jgi:hypothetical protein
MTRNLGSAVVVLVGVLFWSVGARAEDAEDEGDEGSRMRSGVRVGASLNGDQALVGMHLVLASIGDFALGSAVLVGAGEDWMTFRTSALARWDLLQRGDFTLYSVVSGSALLYMPIGKLAAFCSATGLNCSGGEAGLEVGGGVEYNRIGIEATAGLGGLPAVTLLATYDVLR